MTDAPPRFVVDASVGIKLFVDEEYSDKVHTLFDQLAADPPANLYVPDLFYIECTNILLKYTRRFGRSLEDSRADLVDLGRLSLRVVPTAELMEDALLLAAEHNITAYDACYAVLATRLDFPLVTADEPLAKAVGAVRIGALNI
jgi:predicted nucleic acid-binding protein